MTHSSAGRLSNLSKVTQGLRSKEEWIDSPEFWMTLKRPQLELLEWIKWTHSVGFDSAHQNVKADGFLPGQTRVSRTLAEGKIFLKEGLGEEMRTLSMG